MDDLLLLLQAKLDEAKSKGNVNADIEKIQGQIDKLKIQIEIDPKTVSNLVKQLEGILNQKITISNIGIDNTQAVKSAQQTGQQIGNAINKGVSSASSATNKILRDFSELNDAKRQFVDNHDLISKDDIADAEKLYDTVRKAFSEFGQVTVSKGSMNDGSLENMRVKIEQVNGEMKITRDFMLYFNESKNGFKLVDDDTIRTTEKMVQHLNEEKNIINATNEEANAIKAKLAEQEKYYKKLGQASKEQLVIENQRITAGERQLEVLKEQSKRRDSRISYNEGQIDKKGLSDVSKQKELNDLIYSGNEKIDRNFAKEIDKNLSSLSKLKSEWQKQGIYVDEFREKVELLEKSLNDIAIGDIKGLNSLKQQLGSLSEEAKSLNSIHEIQLSIETGGYESKVESLISRTRQWTDEFGNARISTDSLKKALDNLGTASTALSNSNTVENQKALINAEKELDTQVKKVTNDIKIMNLEFMKSSAVDSLRQKYQQFYDLNGRSHRQFGSQLKASMLELSSGAEISIQRGRELNQQLIQIQNTCRQTGKLGKTFFQTIREGMSSFSYWTSSTFLVMKTIQSIKGGIRSVIELATALVDLRKTTSMTTKELEDFYYSSNEVAKQMGVTTKEIIEQAAAWSRLGYNTAETATKMAQLSSKFASISPGMSTDEAQEGLVSIIKAWGLDVDEVERAVMDNINHLGNRFAESNADLVAGMKRSAAALAATGTTYQDAFALFTGMQEVLQNAEVGGRALKSISMRIRGYSEDSENGFEELDEGLKNITGDLIDLTKTAEHTRGVSIFKEGSDTEFKSLVQYFGEIHDIWDEMSQVQQNDFLEKAFGKNQAQAGSALIQNYEAVVDAIEAMENAAGSSEREMSVIMDSLDYKLNALKETGTSVAQNLFKREDMKTVIDGLTSVMNVIDKLTSKLGLFGSIGAGAGLFAGFKNIGKPV